MLQLKLWSARGVSHLIASFFTLQDNILLQQNDLLQQNKSISKNNVQNWFPRKEKWRVNKSAYCGTEQLKSSTRGFQNYKQQTCRALERNYHKLEQYWMRECLEFSGIPSSFALKHLENFVLRLLQEIGIDLDKSWIVDCHRLRKTDRAIVKSLNREDAKNVFFEIFLPSFWLHIR